jgi:4-hydroxy-tetrahydrodipicolinate synthase
MKREIGKISGCWTAIVTPFNSEGEVDYKGLEKNIEFLINNGSNLVPTGTTGESCTLSWREHKEIISKTIRLAGGKSFVIAGTGSNCTEEALEGSKYAIEAGAQGVLLVDCYYNCPSSLELRVNYYEIIAKALPEAYIVPYVIPSRTGTKLEVEDLAILHRKFKNVRSIKEATGDFDRMIKTRNLCGDNFDILSGDDDKTFQMMTSSVIQGAGVISVMSNIVPGPINNMVKAILEGDMNKASHLNEVLSPLFKVVTVNTVEFYEGFSVPCKFRNPVPIKTIMRGLGMPAGYCRPPLGRTMTPSGVEIIRSALKEVYERDKNIFKPIEEFYKVDVQERINDDHYWDQ